METDRDLIPLNNTAHLVALYNNSLADLKTASEIMKRVQRNLKTSIGKGSIFRDFRADNIRVEKDYIKQNFWAFIVDKTNLRILLSQQKLRELDETLYDAGKAKDLPEITEENIFSFLKNNIKQAGTLVDEAIREVFNILTPQKTWSDYKTNNDQEIGEKVILEGVIINSYGGFYMNSRKEPAFNSIDKLFHLMAGKGIPKYPDTLYSKIQKAVFFKTMTAETDYFKIKLYKKGTAHIEFKRSDLVKEINKRVGANVLKRSE